MTKGIMTIATESYSPTERLERLKERRQGSELEFFTESEMRERVLDDLMENASSITIVDMTDDEPSEVFALDTDVERLSTGLESLTRLHEIMVSKPVQYQDSRMLSIAIASVIHKTGLETSYLAVESFDLYRDPHKALTIATETIGETLSQGFKKLVDMIVDFFKKLGKYLMDVVNYFRKGKGKATHEEAMRTEVPKDTKVVTVELSKRSSEVFNGIDPLTVKDIDRINKEYLMLFDAFFEHIFNQTSRIMTAIMQGHMVNDELGEALEKSMKAFTSPSVVGRTYADGLGCKIDGFIVELEQSEVATKSLSVEIKDNDLPEMKRNAEHVHNALTRRLETLSKECDAFVKDINVAIGDISRGDDASKADKVKSLTTLLKVIQHEGICIKDIGKGLIELEKANNEILMKVSGVEPSDDLDKKKN